jgi:hypothetical protein
VKAGLRVAVYVTVLVVVLGGSFYLARVIPRLVHEHTARAAGSPSQAAAASPGQAPVTAPTTEPDPGRGTGPDADSGAVRMPETAATPTALSSATAGYRLTSTMTSLPAGVSQPFRFQLLGPDGQPLRVSPDDADDLHVSLVVVRRDGAAFGHFEPVQDMTGTWTVPLTLPAGGSYAAWVSFTPREHQEIVLGTDLTVAGQFTPQTPPSAAPSADSGGYHVALAGTPTAGVDSPLTLTVSQNGTPVSDLQIDDGAFAHLVMIRAGDLAFADAHPAPVAGHDGALRFTVHPTAAGTCWIYVVFRHHDQTHIAALTMLVAAPTPAGPTPTPTPTAAPAAAAAPATSAGGH